MFGCWNLLSDAEKSLCFERKSKPHRMLQYPTQTLGAWKVGGKLEQEWNRVAWEIKSRTEDEDFRQIISPGVPFDAVIRWTLYLVGKKSKCQYLTPTIVAECRDLDLAKKACKALIELRQYALESVLGTYEIHYAQAIIRLRADRTEGSLHDSLKSWPDGPRQSLCGAQIIACSADHDPDKPFVTLTSGGVLIIDGTPYALTVAHSFRQINCHRQNSSSRNDEVVSSTDPSPEGSDGYSDSDGNSGNSNASIPTDVAVYATHCDAHLIDAETLCLSMPPVIEGAQRINNGIDDVHINFEEDWALIPVNNDRFSRQNWFRTNEEDRVFVTAIAEDMPLGEVTINTSISLPQRTSFSRTQSLFLLPNSGSFQLLWCAIAASKPGDSGAWAIDSRGWASAMLVAAAEENNELFFLPLAPIMHTIRHKVCTDSGPSIETEHEHDDESEVASLSSMFPDEVDTGSGTNMKVDNLSSHESSTQKLRDTSAQHLSGAEPTVAHDKSEANEIKGHPDGNYGAPLSAQHSSIYRPTDLGNIKDSTETKESEKQNLNVDFVDSVFESAGQRHRRVTIAEPAKPDPYQMSSGDARNRYLRERQRVRPQGFEMHSNHPRRDTAGNESVVSPSTQLRVRDRVRGTHHGDQDNSEFPKTLQHTWTEFFQNQVTSLINGVSKLWGATSNSRETDLHQTIRSRSPSPASSTHSELDRLVTALSGKLVPEYLRLSLEEFKRELADEGCSTPRSVRKQLVMHDPFNALPLFSSDGRPIPIPGVDDPSIISFGGNESFVDRFVDKPIGAGIVQWQGEKEKRKTGGKDKEYNTSINDDGIIDLDVLLGPNLGNNMVSVDPIDISTGANDKTASDDGARSDVSRDLRRRRFLKDRKLVQRAVKSSRKRKTMPEMQNTQSEVDAGYEDSAQSSDVSIPGRVSFTRNSREGRARRYTLQPKSANQNDERYAFPRPALDNTAHKYDGYVDPSEFNRERQSRNQANDTSLAHRPLFRHSHYDGYQATPAEEYARFEVQLRDKAIEILRQDRDLSNRERELANRERDLAIKEQSSKMEELQEVRARVQELLNAAQGSKGKEELHEEQTVGGNG